MDKEIKLGNIIMAEFTGWQKLGTGDYLGYIPTKKKKVLYKPSQFRYHNSTAWITIVVKKISDMIINKDWPNLQEALIMFKPIQEELQKAATTKLWDVTLAFVLWYNSNQPQGGK